MSKLSDLVRLQSTLDVNETEKYKDQQVRLVRKFIVGASAFLARICDKDDHGTVLPTDEMGNNVTNVLLRESLRMANVLSVDLDEAYEFRIGEIKRKYGNVRIMLGKE